MAHLGASAKALAQETIVSVLYFPLWWYGAGLRRVLAALGRSFTNYHAALGVSVWVKNLFTPMYGVRDITGKLISFFIRLFEILGRALVLLVWAALLGIFLMAYLALPLFALWQIISQFSTLLALAPL